MFFQKILYGLDFGLRLGTACFLFFSFFYFSYVGATTLLKKSSLVLRWCATFLLGMCFSTITFHLLIALHCFQLQFILPLFMGVVFTVHRYGTSIFLFKQQVFCDVRCFFLILKHTFRSPFRYFFYLFWFGVLLTFCKTLLIPPLGWDFWIYHGVKSAMWAQTGSPITMTAPGGWSVHKLRFGGGDVFAAWGMLPFQSDLLVGVLDFLFWCGLGLSCYAFGQALRVRTKFCWIGTFYCLYIPMVWSYLGSGYVEISLYLNIMLGLLFALHFLQKRQTSFFLFFCIAFSLASGIKFTALPIFVVIAIFLFMAVIVQKTPVSSLITWTFLALLTVAILLGPWCLENFKETGYPFGQLAIEVAGWKLGEANEEMKWYQYHPHLLAYDLRAELYVFLETFAFPFVQFANLSIFSLLPVCLTLFFLGGPLFFKHNMTPIFSVLFLLLGILLNPWTLNALIVRVSFHPQPISEPVFWGSVFGIELFFLGLGLYGLRYKKFLMEHPPLIRPLWILWGLFLIVLYTFYQPNFSSIRLTLGHTSRFLVPLLLPALFFSLIWCRVRHSRLSQGYAWYLVSASMLHIADVFWNLWSLKEKQSSIIFCALLLLGVSLLIRFKGLFLSLRRRWLWGTLSLFLFCSIGQEYREASRYSYIEQFGQVTLQPVYWLSAVPLVDIPEHSYRIAVTGGAHQNLDNFFMYFFLGRRLQNSFFYIPTTKDGSIFPLAPTSKKYEPDFSAWRARLISQKIDYVISFFPISQELFWMEQHPEWFERVTENTPPWGMFERLDIQPGQVFWGLYRIKKI